MIFMFRRHVRRPDNVRRKLERCALKEEIERRRAQASRVVREGCCPPVVAEEKESHASCLNKSRRIVSSLAIRSSYCALICSSSASSRSRPARAAWLDDCAFVLTALSISFAAAAASRFSYPIEMRTESRSSSSESASRPT